MKNMALSDCLQSCLKVLDDNGLLHNVICESEDKHMLDVENEEFIDEYGASCHYELMNQVRDFVQRKNLRQIQEANERLEELMKKNGIEKTMTYEEATEYINKTYNKYLEHVPVEPITVIVHEGEVIIPKGEI